MKVVLVQLLGVGLKASQRASELQTFNHLERKTLN